MASADMQKPQSKEDEVNRSDPDFLPNNRPNPSPVRDRKSQRGTRQLDFFQAMSDFRQMFPTMEDDVIEAVLRANDGAVDATIDQLLTMSIDADEPPDLAGFTHTATVEAYCPKYEEHDSSSPSEDSPPSYSEAIRSQPEQSIWTTPISSQISATSTVPQRNTLDIDVDPLSLSNTEPKFSPRSHPATRGVGFHRHSMSDMEHLSFGTGHGHGHRLGASQSFSDGNTPRKTVFRNWNPPMLGNLPDDFLRLVPPDTPSWPTSTTAITSTPVTAIADLKPRVHRVRSKSEKMSKSSSKDSKTKTDGEKKTKSDKVSRSFSVAESGSNSKSSSSKMSRSLSARNQDMNGAWSRDFNSSNSRSPTQQTMVFQTHDFSTNMLHEKMRENERRRKRTSMDLDPALAQYLEDERQAIILQNSEFLQELRGNEDFMKTLERDQMVRSRVEPVTLSVPEPLLPTPEENVSEGYGRDNQDTLDAFPFSQPMGKDKDEDAELRQQLKQMGRASRKQFAALARKFFRRKKKTSKQILGEKLAPSMMNLLDDEEDDDFESPDRRDPYDQSPEIEPLPTSLLGVPSHRTVQRPMYHPEGVTTHFDSRTTDMV